MKHNTGIQPEVRCGNCRRNRVAVGDAAAEANGWSQVDLPAYLERRRIDLITITIAVSIKPLAYFRAVTLPYLESQIPSQFYLRFKSRAIIICMCTATCRTLVMRNLLGMHGLDIS